MKSYRSLTSILLMILGAVMLVRGLEYAIRHGLGWRGIVMASLAGGLVFALGFTRWCSLRQK